ncbi:MAG: class I tRNA ligase family protein [Candidatus Hodgkinia cicadicola]
MLESIKSLEDVCITRSKTANYGIKLTTGHLKLTLWVWIDAILAYLRNELAYKIHIIGKDVTKFHLTYYLALALLSNSKLPKSIVQHSHITTLETKVSKSLGNQLKSTSFRTTELYYYLSTRLPKHDIKLNESELAAAANKLINNVGNLAKRLTKLLKLNQPKLKWLTASDWILITYVRQLEAALKHLIKNFKVNEINNITLNGAAKINALISNYKLWQHARAGHKLFIYRFATKQYIKWLKHNIGGAATLINLNMQNANTNYTPFLRS